MDYIKLNKDAYDKLANEYNERTYLINEDFWTSIYKDIHIKDFINVLEIGPGKGINLNVLKNFNSTVTAVELSKNMYDILKSNFPEIELINDNILECDFPKESFDIIFMSAVIHNFPIADAKKLLDKIKKWLKSNGYLIISTTVNDKDDEGIIEKVDYSGHISRFRHRYTKESFEQLISDTGYKIYKPYLKKEEDRNKLWYIIVCNKIQ